MSDNIAVMWDCLGLEAAINVTEIEKKRTWAVLQGRTGREVPAPPNILHWELRARANPQRNYEIYIVTVDEGITVEDITSAFEANPQGMADTVRKIGHKFYSNRRQEQEVRIR
jgi:hypothetical protein